MNINNILEDKRFKILNESDFQREITGVYCCDLLSIVMGRAPADCAWVTVMGNINSVAVSVLADMGVIVIAEGMVFDDVALQKAKEQDVNVITTELTIFEAATIINQKIN